MNKGTVIPVAGRRLFRDHPIPIMQIIPLLGAVHEGTLECSLLYGRAGDALSRRYKLKLDLTVNWIAGGVGDLVREEIDEPI